MKVLVACEYSGAVRDAFRDRGHNAWSCDLLPTDADSAYHYECDVREILVGDWDLVVAHPPCQYLCSSGLHWNHRVEGRQAKTDEAIEFFMMFTKLTCKWAIENPIGCMGRLFRKADQYIQPHQFGHDASKKTGLWLSDLPPLAATENIAPRMVNGKARWANQTDSGQNRLGPSSDRWKLRSKTYQGIADAMAAQWGEA